MGKSVNDGPVLVVDDDAALRQLVCELLEGEGYCTVEAASGPEALVWARESGPSMVVLDVNLPGLSGYEVCAALRRSYGPQLPIIFLSGERIESFDRVAGLLLGADDYLVKPFAPDELLVRIRRLLERGTNRNGNGSAALTSRENEVLQLLAEGLDQPEIAERLVISSKTVATHLERILAKLGARSRAQAVAIAYRDGLVKVASLH
jgi:DNA-binding NarL/FixJ family response regulator